jgi:glycosyltransferase involved in cell wall biosynthesis
MARLLDRGFFIGGFESSTMRRRDGRRNDLVSATRHDLLAQDDYARLREVGITTVREGASWPRLEPTRGRFAPDPVLTRIRAAEALGIQVIWDLCHFGWPDDLDPWAADFPDRLGDFARRFAELLRAETSGVPWYVPVNEPSFVAWAGGDVGYLNPFATGRGAELKRQLVLASLAAGAAVRAVDSRARICHVDPIIHIELAPDSPESATATTAHNEAQYEAWDMIAGRQEDELGGSEAELDVIGVNYYDRNQWIDRGPTLRIGDPGYRPLRDMLASVYERYRRPMLIAETGAEGAARVPWLRYVADEVAAARASGVDVGGICLYPVIDYPGWDDDRHVSVGLWGYPDVRGDRPGCQPLLDELARQTARFAASADHLRRVARARGPASHGFSVANHGRRTILLATDSRTPSGLGRQMLTLASGLADRYRVALAAPDAADARWLLDAAEEQGLDAWRLPDATPTAQAAELRSRLEDHAIDLVNIHAGIGWEGHEAVDAASQARVPAIIRTEHLPFLLTKPRDVAEYSARIGLIDRVIGVSAGVADSYVRAGVPAANVRTVRNGIPEPRRMVGPAETRQRFGIEPGARLLVSVGRITPQKGYDVLLAAAAIVIRELPDARFAVVGSGPLARDIDASRRALGLEDTVLRLPSWEDVPSLLDAADAVVLPSRFEGLPLVALEAMACERPVVGTRVCGIDEAVEHSVTGLLVEPDDPRALADAILALLADPATAAEYGRNGRRRYQQRFTAGRMVDDTTDVYEELLAATAINRSEITADAAGAADAVGARRS